MRKTVRCAVRCAFGLALLCAATAQASTQFFDFNSDPTTSGLLTLYGNANWYSYDGVGAATNANDGYLEVTAAARGLRSAIVFADFDNGAVIQGFTFEADLRIGNGTTTPADGFSINYVRANDPVLSVVANGGNPTTASTDPNPPAGAEWIGHGVFATGPNNEDNLPEEGTWTGISIGFDAWDSGPDNSTGPWPFEVGGAAGCGPGDGWDIRGIDVRVDGWLVRQYPMPVLNGAVDNPSSIQTGPNDGSNTPAPLGWAHLKVALSTNGLLNVWWKGTQLVNNYQTTYAASPGALVFAGRTGDAWQIQDIDNISITTIAAAGVVIGTATGLPDGCSVTFYDSGPGVVDTTKLATVQIDGGPALAATLTKAGTTSTVVYHGFPTLLAAGSSHTVTVTVTDTLGRVVTAANLPFTVPAYPVVDSSWTVTGVDTNQPGFRILPWQSGAEPNNNWWADEQLRGLHGANNADLSAATDGGYIDFTGVINFNIGGNQNGNFQLNNGYYDNPFPGIPGANGLNGSTALEVLCFLQFTNGGLYTMGVNSDDGFNVTVGPNPSDWGALSVGQFNGPRGSSDTIFTFVVTNAGIYPFRLQWENGNGELPGNGANLEWFVVQPDGTKILVNDPSKTNTTAVTAFFKGPPLPAYVSELVPNPGATGVRATGFIARLTDGSTTVTPDSITLTINGVAFTLAVSQANGVTTVTLPAGELPPAGTNTAQLVYSTSGGGPFTNTWNFTVMAYQVVNASWAVTGVDTQPGFRILPWQSGAEPNRVYWMQEQLEGLHGANNADLSAATDGGYIDYTDVINFNIAPASSGGSDVGNFTTANGYPDGLFPGIPGGNGLNGSTALEVLCFLQFQQPGSYVLGVNSDDGFIVTMGPDPRDRLATVCGQWDGGRGAADSTFQIVATNAGIYPFCLRWENGNGELPDNGANLEWFVVQPDGTKILVNDPSPPEDTGIKAFFKGPALPAYVSQLNPYDGQTGCWPDHVVIQFTAGSTQVSPTHAPVLLIDGVATSPVITQQGALTTLVLTLPPPGLSAGQHTATLLWSDTGTINASNSWSFTVGTFPTLNQALSVPVNAVDKTQPGFVLKVTQLDPATGGDPGDYTANQCDENNSLLAGLYFPWFGTNTADTVNGGSSGMPAVMGNLWYWTNVVDFNIVTSGGDFANDYGLPGIPGVTGNANYFAAGFQTYVVFPAAGFCRMGVNSDDGFRLTEGIGVTRQAVHVTGPGIDTDIEGVNANTNNSTFGGSLPVPPITGPVVYVGEGACPNLPAIDLTNKIGVILNTHCGASTVYAWAWYLQTNGAIGAIILNDPSWGMPYLAGGGPRPVTIPVVMSSSYAGQLDFWKTNANLVASIGADAHLQLGQADYGKGMSDIDFGFWVPAAGAYPLRLLYYQGAGGAGCEWSTVIPGAAVDGGVRSLVNDTMNPQSLLAYRAVTVLPTLHTPTLAKGMVTVTWNGAGILQSSPTLSPAHWTNVDPQPGNNVFTTLATSGAKYFRVTVPVPVEP